MKKTSKREVTPVLSPAQAITAAKKSKKKKTYPGTEQDLYDYTRMGWNNYIEYFPAFHAFSEAFTESLGPDQLKFIAETQALPGYVALSSMPEEVRLALESDNKVVLTLFKQGRWFIEQAWTDKAMVDIKLKAAGNGNFRSASANNWHQTRKLITEFKTFLEGNTAELTANKNMPAEFPATFSAAADRFVKKWDQYKAEQEAASKGTGDKSELNEQIYDRFRKMCEVGSTFLFADNPQLREKFVIANLYKEVKAKHPSGLKGKITPVDSKKPIVKAKILIMDESGKFVLTDAKGKYELKLASGTYTVEIQAEGYETLRIEKLEVKVGVMSRLNRSLTPLLVAAPVVEVVSTPTADALAMAEKMDHAVAELQQQVEKNGVLITG